MKNLKSKTLNGSMTALALISASITKVVASGTSTINIPGFENNPISLGAGFGFNSPGTAVNSVVQLILAGAAVVAFIFILWGAFKYVTAGDDSAKTQAARSTITNAVVGLILVALSYVIWLIVVNITQLNTGVNPIINTN